MENSTNFLDILRDLGLQLPSLLTMLACVLVAILRWKKHPKVSLAVIAGLGLMVVHAVVFAFVYAFVPDLFLRPGSYGMMRTVINIISFLYNSSLAIAFGILLWAVFMNRDEQPSLTETRGTLA